MTTTNAYGTLTEFKSDKRISSTDATDDSVIEGILDDASRLIDIITGRHFYAITDTREYDTPDGDLLWLDEDLLTITTLTNGSAGAVTATYYTLRPNNGFPKYAIKLKDTSGMVWQLSSTGSREGAVTVAGTWGYCDRASSDADSVTAVRNTRMACLEIAVNNYQQRFGQLGETNVQITAAGVIVTPHGAIPKAALERIQSYIKVV